MSRKQISIENDLWSIFQYWLLLKLYSHHKLRISKSKVSLIVSIPPSTKLVLYLFERNSFPLSITSQYYDDYLLWHLNCQFSVRTCHWFDNVDDVQCLFEVKLTLLLSNLLPWNVSTFEIEPIRFNCVFFRKFRNKKVPDKLKNFQ